MKNIFFKAIIPVILVMALLFSVSAENIALTDGEGFSEPASGDESVQDSMFGDVNNDGKINALDARKLLRCSALIEEITPEIIVLGDYTQDSVINASDARIALRVAAKIDSIECIFSGHTYALYTVLPNCTTDGYTTNKCIRCAATDGSSTDIVPASGHKLSSTKTAPTCTAAGWLKEFCSVCGFVSADRADGKALGHKFGEWKKTNNTEKRTCSRCKFEESRKVKSDKVIYLTFDDGPGPYTEKLLRYLRQYDVKATFFVTNQSPRYIHLLKTMADDGHAIGVHTLTHNWNIYSSEEKYMKDFNAMHKIIKDETGIDTKIFRFPGGTNNTVSRSYSRGIMTRLAKKMTAEGYYYFDWNVDCYDTSGYNSTQIANTTIAQIKNRKTSIVLMHDIKNSTVESVKRIIEFGLANGYTFEVLDENSPAIRFSPAN